MLTVPFLQYSSWACTLGLEVARLSRKFYVAIEKQYWWCPLCQPETGQNAILTTSLRLGSLLEEIIESVRAETSILSLRAFSKRLRLSLSCQYLY